MGVVRSLRCCKVLQVEREGEEYARLDEPAKRKCLARLHLGAWGASVGPGRGLGNGGSRYLRKKAPPKRPPNDAKVAPESPRSDAEGHREHPVIAPLALPKIGWAETRADGARVRLER